MIVVLGSTFNLVNLLNYGGRNAATFRGDSLSRVELDAGASVLHPVAPPLRPG